jgi:hypothetical protein
MTHCNIDLFDAVLSKDRAGESVKSITPQWSFELAKACAVKKEVIWPLDRGGRAETRGTP